MQCIDLSHYVYICVMSKIIALLCGFMYITIIVFLCANNDMIVLVFLNCVALYSIFCTIFEILAYVYESIINSIIVAVTNVSIGKINIFD